MKLSTALGLSLAAAFGATITNETMVAYVHTGGIPIALLTPASIGYSSSFLENGTGTFGWSFKNNSNAVLSNVNFAVFLDADIDRDTNSFFNEYGEFVSLALPVFAPVGALAATSWEIDEPGLVFGDILLNLENGALDGSNGVPSSAPDDVSLALGFSIGSLAPTATLHTVFSISREDIGGLRQIDPDSGFDFYLNGYALVQEGIPPDAVPEPSTALLLAAGLALIWKVRR